MLESFKNLLRKPEFPDFPYETDYLSKEYDADTPISEENLELDEQDEKEGKGKDETVEPEETAFESGTPSPPRKKTGAWARTVVGIAAIVGIACLGYYWVASSDTLAPASIPQGDILASLTALPTAVPPDQTSPPPSVAEAPRQTNAVEMEPVSTKNYLSPVAAAQSPTPTPANPPRQETVAEGATITSSPGAFGTNPFVDLSTLHAAANALPSSGLPPIYGDGNRALPEIPRPEVSPELLPSPGEIRTPPSPVGSSGGAATMGGLIRKPNGESIAIMGDGTVLSEGDSY
ncbi:MAG: hypothetical protein J6N99_11375, partial [Schwartzia sp.]|nr:hypothetical protein [Schwartzia sp. (in: firmicutes)]